MWWVCHATNNFTWVLDVATIYFAFTPTHLTIQYLDCYSTVSAGESIQLSLAVAGSQLFSGGYISTLLSLAVNARLQLYLVASKF
jgi:hypothetical protein